MEERRARPLVRVVGVDEMWSSCTRSSTAKIASPPESVTRVMCSTCSRSLQPAMKASHAVRSSRTKRARRSVPARLRCTIRTRPGGVAPPPIDDGGIACSEASASTSSSFGSSQNEMTVPIGPHRKSAASSSFSHGTESGSRRDERRFSRASRFGFGVRSGGISRGGGSG